jgi:hypothetical protein
VADSTIKGIGSEEILESAVQVANSVIYAIGW